MKFGKLIAAIALAGAAVPAAVVAQNAVELTVGATVYGPQGGEVGTIESVDGDNVTVNTGTNSAALPANAFGKGTNGPIIGLTREQLDSAIEAANKAAAEKAAAEAEARLQAAYVAGADVRSVDGVAMGTIESIGEDGVAVLITEISPVNLPRDQFTADENGLMLRVTAQQLNDALNAALAAQ